MRSDYPRRNTSAVVWLVAALVSAFVLEELILLSPLGGSTGAGAIDRLTLTIRGLQNGQAWTLLTHSLFHAPKNPFAILFTILGLIFVGREVEPLVGARRFLSVYFGAVVLGALCWIGVHWTHGGAHLGASAGVLGLFVLLASLYPNQEIRFLIFFLFPVTLRPKYFVYGLLALNGLGLIFYEIPGTATPFDYSPSAQLGGMLAGWIYFRYFHANNGMDRAPTISLPSWLQGEEEISQKTPPPASPRTAPSTATIRAEVDVILDKINSQGFGSLTEDEKRVLDEAKDLLSRP